MAVSVRITHSSGVETPVMGAFEDVLRCAAHYVAVGAEGRLRDGAALARATDALSLAAEAVLIAPVLRPFDGALRALAEITELHLLIQSLEERRDLSQRFLRHADVLAIDGRGPEAARVRQMRDSFFGYYAQMNSLTAPADACVADGPDGPDLSLM